MSEYIKTVKGSINISHDVECPHCKHLLDEYNNKTWWRREITDILPDDEAYRAEYKVKCPMCGEPFKIDGFEY